MLTHAALIAALSLAATALFFALWPVVADAPWEDEIVIPTPVVQDQGEVLLCEAAIQMRDTMRIEIEGGDDLNLTNTRARGLLIEAKADIDRHC